MHKLKLLQESYIRIHKVTKIRYGIADHDETIESESEGKSTIYLWIESSFTDDIGVDESCTHEFYPARSFAYFAPLSITERTREVYLDSWFHEREVSRTHTDSHFFPEYV